MLLAADIGGTNARVGLFTDAAKPVRVELRSYATATMGSFADLVARFTRELGRPLAVTAAGVGIAGPVWNGAARLTNGTWGTTEAEIARACGVQRACLLNDLAALAWGTFAVADASLVTLHAGEADPPPPGARGGSAPGPPSGAKPGSTGPGHASMCWRRRPVTRTSPRARTWSGGWRRPCGHTTAGPPWRTC